MLWTPLEGVGSWLSSCAGEGGSDGGGSSSGSDICLRSTGLFWRCASRVPLEAVRGVLVEVSWAGDAALDVPAECCVCASV